MNGSQSSFRPTSPPDPGELPNRADLLAEIDRSCRLPIGFLIGSSLLWLLLGTILIFIASIQLHVPGFLADCPWMTYGHVVAVATNCLLYGFASQVGLGVGLWMLARLGHTPLAGPIVITIGTLFWNLGLTIGVCGILAGDSTGIEWLEIPRYASPLLFFSYLVIGVCGLLTFQARREATLYVSQWFLLAAFVVFPWIYSVAQLTLVFRPLPGATQIAALAWFQNNFAALWLAPLALAAIFYFIPKILERPLYSRYLAGFAFWTWIIFGTWGGILPGSPLPRWLASVSTAATFLLIAPLLSMVMNWQQTLAGRYNAVKKHSFPLRFIVASVGFFLFATLLEILGSTVRLGSYTQFTLFTTAHAQFCLFGFYGLAMAGAAYYIVPKLLGRALPMPYLVGVHRLCTIVGLLISGLALMMAGAQQGQGLHEAGEEFSAFVRSTVPFWRLSSVGLLLVLLGQTAFVANLGWAMAESIWTCCRACCPTETTHPVKLNLAEERG